MSDIAVIDCGMGNLHSVIAGIHRCDATISVRVVDTASDVFAAEKIIFPGDGHFGACMHEIDKRNLRSALQLAAKEKPFFGICVGMQVLFEASEEAEGVKGLGIFPSTICHLPQGSALKIPHMGWNKTYHYKVHSLTHDISEGEWFYYVHTYCAPIGEWTVMTASHGMTFSSIVARDNLFATQFHPEKSGRIGLQLLEKFIAV